MPGFKVVHLIFKKKIIYFNFFIIVIAPNLCAFLARNKLVEFFPSEPAKFLEEVTNAIIARRKAKLDVRDDFIQSMIEHEEDTKNQDSKEVQKDEQEKKAWNGPLNKKLTDREILSQAILFLAAGYETTATTLEYISYILAKHQEIQDTLTYEIDQVLEKHVF